MKYLSKPLLVSLLGLLIFSGANIMAVNATGTTERPEKQKIETEHSSKKPEIKQLDIPCAQTAVDKREVAVATSVDTYYNTLKTALSVRRTALKSAWAITDNQARTTAVRAAWKTFQDSRRTAQKTYRDNRNAAWKTFKTDRKACGLTSSMEEHIGKDNDFNL